jgi:hypothetical protein
MICGGYASLFFRVDFIDGPPIRASRRTVKASMSRSRGRSRTSMWSPCHSGPSW